MNIRTKVTVFLSCIAMCFSIFALAPDLHSKFIPILFAPFNSLTITGTERILTYEELNQFFSKKKAYGTLILSTKTTKDFTVTAMATDNKRYIANQFLQGYSPYKVTNLWQIMDKMREFEFRADGSLSKTNKDVWLTGKELFTRRIGDCEDYAILLADWMIKNNWDARIALGTLNNISHAWVLLRVNKKDYILDGTKKSLFSQYRQFSLAKHKPEYKHEYMFNRNEFWSYEKGKSNSEYSKANWTHKSHLNR
jgi:predicted transglutaminase-like cysteine proteinase